MNRIYSAFTSAPASENRSQPVPVLAVRGMFQPFCLTFPTLPYPT